ncbi:MAG: hypothetical protein [Bacteriophage sp.]|nr:MAG: hypothetical protein [Bacteriophage sp.]
MVLTDALLAQTSTQRLIHAANYKHSQLLMLTAPDAELGLAANAQFLDVEPYNSAPYTGKAVFQINRAANPTPYNVEAPTRPVYTRRVLIKQITDQEILDLYGINGTIYLGLTKRPATTDLLAASFASVYGLQMQASDIVAETIPSTAQCVIVRFNPRSVGYKGALRVDLVTPFRAPA